MDRITVNAAQFDIVHKGIFNVLEQHVGKAAADKGDVMVLVSGKSKSNAGQHLHIAAFVTGTVYSPKVFDVTRLDFEHVAASARTELQLPCNLKIASRVSLLSSQFEAIHSETSDEFVKNLTEAFLDMTLHSATYVPVNIDGTLLWSRLDGAQALCLLWEPGKKAPLSFAKKPAHDQAFRDGGKLLKSLNTADPLSSSVRHVVAGVLAGSKRITRASWCGVFGAPGKKQLQKPIYCLEIRVAKAFVRRSVIVWWRT